MPAQHTRQLSVHVVTCSSAPDTEPPSLPGPAHTAPSICAMIPQAPPMKHEGETLKTLNLEGTMLIKRGNFLSQPAHTAHATWQRSARALEAGHASLPCQHSSRRTSRERLHLGYRKDRDRGGGARGVVRAAGGRQRAPLHGLQHAGDLVHTGPPRVVWVRPRPLCTANRTVQRMVG